MYTGERYKHYTNRQRQTRQKLEEMNKKKTHIVRRITEANKKKITSRREAEIIIKQNSNNNEKKYDEEKITHNEQCTVCMGGHTYEVRHDDPNNKL